MSETRYQEVIRGDESLASFLRAMKKFDQDFCNLMASQVDFTLKLEIHGDQGNLIHCRVLADSFDRPVGVQNSENKKNGVARTPNKY